MSISFMTEIVIVDFQLNIGLYLTICEDLLMLQVIINMIYVILSDVQSEVEDEEYSLLQVKLDTLFYPIHQNFTMISQISPKDLVIKKKYFTIPLHVDLNTFLNMIGSLLIFFMKQILINSLLYQDALAQYVRTGVVRMAFRLIDIQVFQVQ